MRSCTPASTSASTCATPRTCWLSSAWRTPRRFAASIPDAPRPYPASHSIAAVGMVARAESLKGHLDMLLLAAVSAEPAHGYRLVLRLRELSGGAFDLPEGTIYPALYRLERAGLVGSEWA